MQIRDPEFFRPWIRDPGWKDTGQTSRIRNTDKDLLPQWEFWAIPLWIEVIRETVGEGDGLDGEKMLDLPEQQAHRGQVRQHHPLTQLLVFSQP